MALLKQSPGERVRLLKSKAVKVGLGVAAWETFWWARRSALRGSTYEEARFVAKTLGKPLVVIGAPDRGATASPGADADLVIDIGPSTSVPPAKFLQADICKPLPLADNSCVVFVSCVLEYVDDAVAALAELQRISGGPGGWLYVVRVEPWTLTAYLYPGARRTVAPVRPSADPVFGPAPAPSQLSGPTPSRRVVWRGYHDVFATR